MVEGTATERKRRQLSTFVDRHVRPHESIKAVVVYGSVALGLARPDSDVDAFVFMDPLDTSSVPAEAVWDPGTDSFRSIFADVEPGPDDLQVDLTRVSLAQWREPEFAWPATARAVLAHRWVAFERPGTGIEALIDERIRMTPLERRRLLDRALLDADGLLEDPARLWAQDDVEAFDVLNAMWEALVDATYAVNGAWSPYRGRALRGLRTLPWRGALTDGHLAGCVAPAARDEAAFLARAGLLAEVHAELLDHLTAEPEFGEDPTFSAFLRAHDEPGRAWNMDEWNRGRPTGR